MDRLARSLANLQQVLDQFQSDRDQEVGLCIFFIAVNAMNKRGVHLSNDGCFGNSLALSGDLSLKRSRWSDSRAAVSVLFGSAYLMKWPNIYPVVLILRCAGSAL